MRGAQDTTRGQGPTGAPGADPQPRPYNQVITPNAKSREGMFKTHRIGSRVLFEIPTVVLGRDLLLVTRAARVPVNAGYGGQQVAPTLVVRWERREHRILFRTVSYETVADSTTPIYQAVRNANSDAILASFNVEAYGPDSAAVIDVTRLYTAPPNEIGPGAQFRGAPDPTRSFIDRVLSFPQNVEVEATLTIPAPPPGGSGAPANQFAPVATGTATVGMHWSMVKLPDRPMMPRLADKRVGFFSIDNLDYGRPEQRAQQRTLASHLLEHVLPGDPLGDIARRSLHAEKGAVFVAQQAGADAHVVFLPERVAGARFYEPAETETAAAERLEEIRRGRGRR